MKIMKAMKKLKLWGRKKRKRKQPIEPQMQYYNHQPAYHYSYHSSSSSAASQAQPSAPPLPPWLDGLLRNQETVSGLESSSVYRISTEEICVETNSLLRQGDDVSSHRDSYQQYTVPNPVYGLPVVQTVGAEKSSGLFGCVVGFSTNLIRCFVPCFTIKEACPK